MNTTIQMLLNLVMSLLPEIGAQARPAVVRACTVPEEDVTSLCAGMTTPQQIEAEALARAMANAEANFVLYVASRGTIAPQ